MILKSKTDTDFIVIMKVYEEEKRVIYKHYKQLIKQGEFEFEVVKEQRSIVLENVEKLEIDATLTLKENFEKPYYLALLKTFEVEGENEFEFSLENDNWVFDKAIRISIDNEKSTNELVNNIDYRNLFFDILNKHDDFAFANKRNAILYVDTIEDSDASVISDFIFSETNPTGWIYIENKL